MTTPPLAGLAPLVVRARDWLAANTWTPARQPTALRRPIFAYLAASAAVALAAALTSLLEHGLPHYAFHGMLGILALVGVSVLWGRGPALVGALLNAIVLNFVVLAPGSAAPSAHVPAVAAHLLTALLTLCFGAAVTMLTGLSESRQRQLVVEHAARERLLASEQRAHVEAQAERRRLHQILEMLPAGVAVYSGDGEIVMINPAAQALLGSDLLAPHGASVKDDPQQWDDTPLFQQVTRALRMGDTVRGGRFVAHHAAIGTEIAVLVNTAPLRDPAGAVTGALAVYQDISGIVELERRQAELLARSEAALRRLEAVQAVTDTALAHLPAQDLLRQLVARVAQALGVDNAALLLVTEDGRSLVVYLAHGVEADQEGAVIVPIGQGVAGRIAASRQPLIVDDVRSADVSNVRLLTAMRSLAGVPIMVQDRLVGVLHADSTSLRRFTAEDLEVLRLVAERIGLVVENGRLYAEAQQRSADLAAERNRLQRILDVLPEAVVIFDADSRVSAMNPVGKTLFGANIAGEKRYDFAMTVRLPDGTPVAFEQFPSTRALTAGETSRSVRLLLRTAATGDDVPVLTNCAPLRDTDGAITGAVVVAQDISPLVELERQRELMLSMVTHDLRNPLTTIFGMSQLLQQHVARVDEPARERFTRGLKHIERAAERVMAQIGDLLDHGRALAGHALELTLEATDIVALLRGVLEEHQQVTDLHRLELRCAEERIVALVDRRRLERAVTNLVGNAVKYSPRGGPVVVTVARAVGPDGPWLSVEVADSGIGIPSADLPHMFEQYYRASNVAATIPGSGIGLAGTRHMIQQHGGTLALASTEGVGTTVTMRVPLRQEAELDAGEASSTFPG
ncbi:MAG TPA: ATP-binding protein [Chloroflexota bacterium]|nr:ATP-binding protein [Chloroflexota bacterium]